MHSELGDFLAKCTEHSCLRDGRKDFARFEVVRHTFDLLIQKFNTYQGMLSKIKFEYDEQLEIRRDKALRLEAKACSEPGQMSPQLVYALL